jgi:hypothetical protein
VPLPDGLVRTVRPDDIQHLQSVLAELRRADAKFPDQSIPDGTGTHGSHHTADLARMACKVANTQGTLTWAAVLAEEYYEAMAETDPARLSAELDQVMAVCLRWKRDIAYRAANPDAPTVIPPDDPQTRTDTGADRIRQEVRMSWAEYVGGMYARHGSSIERWLERWRDTQDYGGRKWTVLDDVLTDYRAHAETGLPLYEKAARYRADQHADPESAHDWYRSLPGPADAGPLTPHDCAVAVSALVEVAGNQFFPVGYRDMCRLTADRIELAIDWRNPMTTDMPCTLVDPHGNPIGITTEPGEHTHACRQGCRLHDPCCDEYARTGWSHTNTCHQTNPAYDAPEVHGS